MQAAEQAAFWREVCRHGIAIYENDADNKDDYLFIIAKAANPADMRIYLDGEHNEMFCENEESAIEFLSAYIDWKSAAIDNDSDDSVPVYRFSVVLMYNYGIGPQTANLGQLTSGCESDGWYEDLMKAADQLAETFVSNELPDQDWDDLQKDVKIQPILQQAS